MSLLVLLAALTGCAMEAAVTPLPVTSSTVGAPAAHLAASPMSGNAGGEIRLSGDGFPANTRVVFTFHGRRVGDATTDAAGGFAGAVVQVPESFRDSPPGTQFLIGATGGPFYAETPFVLTR
ncbi:hypothetical protein ACQPZF_35180 [Actinosynnema sp. CS-041913]|uniref:hypothetical protein n=1 Tax=Actinosynnema sp. CS-041913 TaxID=3239917 RepID=UPI003D8AB55D